MTAGATEPIIYTGGAIVKDNGKVAINFNAAYSALKYTGQDLNLSAVTALVVQRIDTTTSVGGYPIALQNTNNDGLRMFLRNYGLRNRTTGTNLDVSFPQELYFTRNLADIASSTSALKATFNGAVTATASGKTFSTNGLDLAVGGSSYDTVKHTGSMQEAIIFGVDKYTSGDIGSIRENVGDYFTQNTPLLDTYSGAAAAYSLRLLDSTYTGSAIRVRRSSDNTEQDIGFNVFGELSTVELAAFCGSSDGFVKTWYSQVGTGVDATQTTAANQPKIYDSVTGVNTLNGKPAVEFDGSDDNFTSTISNITQSFDVYTVHNFNTTPTTTQRLYDSDNGGRITRGSNGTSNNFAFAGTVLSWSPQQTGQVQETTVYNGASSLVRVNGTQTASGDAGTNSTGTDLVIGADKTASTQFIDGQIQEFIIFDDSKNATDRTGIETNINTFYNIYS